MNRETKSPKAVAPDNGASNCSETGADGESAYDTLYRRHYKRHYANRPSKYETFYAPAYQFGFDLGKRYPNVTWAQLEPWARDRWVTKHPCSWSEIADAVHFGWTQGRMSRL